MKLYKSGASGTFPKAEDCLSEQKLLETRAYGCSDQPEATYSFAKRVSQAIQQTIEHNRHWVRAWSEGKLLNA
jgi:hypothetical protein